MLSLTLDRPRRHRLEVLCLGAHCDDIEIGRGATLMRLADERSIAVSWVILSSTSARAAETRRSAGLLLRRAPSATCPAGSVSRRFSSGAVEGSQQTLRRAQAPASTRRHLHPRARRSASGPPPGLRAYVEHIPRPPDPRVRNPEVRRRHRPAQPVCTGDDCGRGTQVAVPPFGLQEPGNKLLVHTRNVPRPDAPARCRKQRRARLRRGVFTRERP